MNREDVNAALFMGAIALAISIISFVGTLMLYLK